MFAWWGPILHEYYAGTEGNGFCAIDSPQWLAHKGSVGRPTNAISDAWLDGPLKVLRATTSSRFR